MSGENKTLHNTSVQSMESTHSASTHHSTGSTYSQTHRHHHRSNNVVPRSPKGRKLLQQLLLQDFQMVFQEHPLDLNDPYQEILLRIEENNVHQSISSYPLTSDFVLRREAMLILAQLYTQIGRIAQAKVIYKDIITLLSLDDQLYSHHTSDADQENSVLVIHETCHYQLCRLYVTEARYNKAEQFIRDLLAKTQSNLQLLVCRIGLDQKHKNKYKDHNKNGSSDKTSISATPDTNFTTIAELISDITALPLTPQILDFLVFVYQLAEVIILQLVYNQNNQNQQYIHNTTNNSGNNTNNNNISPLKQALSATQHNQPPEEYRSQRMADVRCLLESLYNYFTNIHIRNKDNSTFTNSHNTTTTNINSGAMNIDTTRLHRNTMGSITQLSYAYAHAHCVFQLARYELFCGHHEEALRLCEEVFLLLPVEIASIHNTSNTSTTSKFSFSDVSNNNNNNYNSEEQYWQQDVCLCARTLKVEISLALLYAKPLGQNDVSTNHSATDDSKVDIAYNDTVSNTSNTEYYTNNTNNYSSIDYFHSLEDIIFELHAIIRSQNGCLLAPQNSLPHMRMVQHMLDTMFLLARDVYSNANITSNTHTDPDTSNSATNNNCNGSNVVITETMKKEWLLLAELIVKDCFTQYSSFLPETHHQVLDSKLWLVKLRKQCAALHLVPKTGDFFSTVVLTNTNMFGHTYNNGDDSNDNSSTSNENSFLCSIQSIFCF